MSLSILSYSLITYSFTTLMIHTLIFYFRTHLFNLIFRPNILFYWNLLEFLYMHFYFIL